MTGQAAARLDPSRILTGADVAAVSLATAEATFRRWLGSTYDLDAMRAVASVLAIERLDGDQPWLLLVSGSGAAKTETATSALGAGATATSTITSEGALLSATAARERATDATGGLLRQIGSSGALVIKDVTSILSMGRDARSAVLAALREIADGSWVRQVGIDGGRTLAWHGRIAVIGAVTTAWDTHHGVIASMGDRFLLLRIDSGDPSARMQSGRQALANIGHESRMREELASAMRSLVSGMDPQPFALDDDEASVILSAADLVTRCRTGVERDQRGNVVDAHAPEHPTRLAKQLGQVMRGAVAIGMNQDEALRLALRIARDCMPPLRLAVLSAVLASDGGTCRDYTRALNKPRTTVDRALQELNLLGLLDQFTADGNETWRYCLADVIEPGLLAAVTASSTRAPDLSVQEQSAPDLSVRTQTQIEGLCPPTDKSGQPSPTDISGEWIPA